MATAFYFCLRVSHGRSSGEIMGIKIILEDGFAIEKGTGIGQHTLNLFYQLKKSPQVDSVQLMRKPFLSRVPSAALRRVLYIVWLNTWLQWCLRRKKPDVIHFTNYLIPAVRLSDAQYVVTIHDLTAWKFPETMSRSYLYYIKWATLHAINKADMVFTDTNTVAKEIDGLFHLQRKRVCVMYSGVDNQFRPLPQQILDSYRTKLRKKFSLKPDFLLFTGTIGKRKNIMTLARAFLRLRDTHDLQLVLVGNKGNSYTEVQVYLQQNNLSDHVIFTEYIDRKGLIALYNFAKAFVFPSLYEGFGIPLLEAMACGTPIVASQIPSTEEVVGDAAVYYEKPQDGDALAKAIHLLLNDKDMRCDLSQKGKNRIKKFLWEEIATKHLEAYQSILQTR